MEHSALHGLLLTGLILVLGGPLAAWLLRPGRGSGGRADAAPSAPGPGCPAARSVGAVIARTVVLGAAAAAAATAADLAVQVAEVRGQTVFGGVDPGEIVRYATRTSVGRLALARLACLAATAAAAAAAGSSPRRWWWPAPPAAGAVLATSLVSHAAAQPEGRAAAVALQFGHLAAAAAWIGVLLHLFLARRPLLGAGGPENVRLAARVVRRFSPVALTATGLLGLSGLTAAARFLPDPGALVTSPYGLTLLVKLGLLTPVLYAGFTNFRRVGPALAKAAAATIVSPPGHCPFPGAAARPGGAGADPGPGRVLARFSRLLTLEVLAGVLVVTVAGVLGAVSPPGPDGSLRLTGPQLHALLTPHLPTTPAVLPTYENVNQGLGTDELRYAEFTHNWSGVMVTLMGLGWLFQAAGGRVGAWAGHVFPVLLLGFGAFVAVAADTELWLLHRISLWQALRDPQIVEHQLGAALVFVLAALSWRDLRRPAARRPLGLALPLIMIGGSLLLLGHAHSALFVPDELTTLVNVQHAVFGACGLFAGLTRLLLLLDLLPARPARFVWPGFVVALGLFMAFFYREFVP